MTLIRSNKLPVKHAGLIFNERILIRHNISQTQAAKFLHMSRKQVSLFANGKTSVSISLSKKLEVATGISAGFWLNIQKSYDLYMARNEKVEAEPMYAFG
ncbi:HigA family addiction module antitoxin [Colwellia sp. 20A7]|uniref:HigA family addiction module antitoxin n=1 Tax=Colwellia sp. 20A7 TaxID=2689569 RepID=UPI0013596FFE|nr:HigA family addiction module antitoxin [Colwellia sp. 20A7]